MLTNATIATVKSTIPLLESAGVALTQHFYQRLFKHHPELQNMFNMANQHNGKQPLALFSAIAAYAKHIDTPAMLQQAITRIAHKHTSLYIQPEHYAVVGHHLIETLRELAPHAFTAEVEQAWREAYQYLAQLFVRKEQLLYQQQESAGWTGPRRFTVLDKVVESELVTSFHLIPSDGGPLLSYHAGQYIGVKVKPINNVYTAIRQYSLSDRDHGRSYRISVKREQYGVNPGVVSNYLHDHVQVGSELELMPPAGDFMLQQTAAPQVLISAGVGITPMMAMLETLVEQAARDTTNVAPPVLFLHACENIEQHSFAKRLQQLAQHTPWLHSAVWYRHGVGSASTQTVNSDNRDTSDKHLTFTGTMDLSQLHEIKRLATAPLALTPLDASTQVVSSEVHRNSHADALPQFYLCGPIGFMRHINQQLGHMGIMPTQIHYEVFGAHHEL